MEPIEVKQQPAAAELGYVAPPSVEVAPVSSTYALIEDDGQGAQPVMTAPEVPAVSVAEPVAEASPVAAPAAARVTDDSLPPSTVDLEKYLYS